MKRTEKSPLRDTLARNMRRLRAERGWSQEYLAAETNLNRTYLSAVERSEQNISIDNLYKLAVAFDVSADALIRGKKWGFPAIAVAYDDEDRACQ